MSESSGQYEVTWASDNETLLQVAVDAVVAAGGAASPITRFQWGGEDHFVVRLVNTTGPFADPPVGVRVEMAPVAGVFAQGPAKPSPLEWMDRLAPDRQVAVFEAMEATPQGRWFSRRVLAAREVDVTSDQVKVGVAMMLGAGIITEEEAATLLA